MKNSKEIREQYLIAEGCGGFNKYNETKYSLWLESELIRLSQQSSFFAVSQRSGLVCEHKFGDSYEQMGGGLTLHECEKCGIVQTCG